MLSPNIERALNEQMKLEAESSQFYLAMAGWAENKGYNGTADFMYRHSDEERTHMLKLMKYINERGGKAIVPALPKPATDFKELREVFDTLLSHEEMVTQKINDLVFICLDERDYTTHNFVQWYVSEQIEEEALARTIIDKLNLIGTDKSGMYLFDRDIISINATSAAAPDAAK
ncbi:MAG: ferritin [Flavobacteriales bacterium]|nr:ferritin [Flavobacteriales bacterium]